MYPMPTPAPAKPAAAIPIPNNAEAAESIVSYPPIMSCDYVGSSAPFESSLYPHLSVRVRIVLFLKGKPATEIDARQHRKNIGLNKGDSDLQAVHGNGKG